MNVLSDLMLGTISFPGLGLEFEVDRIAFTIGKFSVYWYAIFIVGAMVISGIIAMIQCKKYGIKDEDVLDNLLFALPAAIIGARIYYVVFEWASFRKETLWQTVAAIFNIRDGGLAIYGGLIAAALAVYVVARVKKINFLHLFDFAVPYIALSQAIGRWGNFVNQEAFGVNTTLPWGMTGDQIVRTLLSRQGELAALGMNVDPYAPVHPTFLYESLCNAIIAVVLFVLRRKFMDRKEGYNTFMYLSLYGLCRAFIEGLRTDSLMMGSIRVSQLVALVCFLACGTLAVLFMRKKASRDYFAGVTEADVYPVDTVEVSVENTAVDMDSEENVDPLEEQSQDVVDNG